MWGLLENLCHRYILVGTDFETIFLTDVPSISTTVRTENSESSYIQRMVDEQDARTVVKSYIARMTPKADVEALSADFCATLVDFIFQHDLSTLGEMLVPLIKVGYERIWMDLMDGVVVRDAKWCEGFIQCVVSTLRGTE